MIRVGDIVQHQLSKLYFICENNRHERWMNMNPFYILAPINLILPQNYFKKTT